MSDASQRGKVCHGVVGSGRGWQTQAAGSKALATVTTPARSLTRDITAQGWASGSRKLSHSTSYKCLIGDPKRMVGSQ